jgi:uncharacterized phage protein (TIGR02216 family)
MTAFPWRALMAFGLGRLGLASAEFWALTPRELAAAAEGVLGVPGRPPDREALARLMTRYPDSPGGPDADPGR